MLQYRHLKTYFYKFKKHLLINTDQILLIESQCLPPISVVQSMLGYSNIQIEAHENYQKRSFRNRFFINSPQGKSLVSIPLKKGKNNQTLITDVEIAYHTNWVEILEKKIKSCYSNAPFFEYYQSYVLDIFKKKPKNLVELNAELLQLIFTLLQIDATISYSNCYATSLTANFVDFRNHFQLNPMRSCPAYDQVFESATGFVSDLSILDLLFCCGPESRIVLLQRPMDHETRLLT